MEKKEFQNRIFLFSNFLGAAILNNCDVKWLPFCYETKALCLITKGQNYFSPVCFCLRLMDLNICIIGTL